MEQYGNSKLSYLTKIPISSTLKSAVSNINGAMLPEDVFISPFRILHVNIIHCKRNIFERARLLFVIRLFDTCIQTGEKYILNEPFRIVQTKKERFCKRYICSIFACIHLLIFCFLVEEI